MDAHKKKSIWAECICFMLFGSVLLTQGNSLFLCHNLNCIFFFQNPVNLRWGYCWPTAPAPASCPPLSLHGMRARRGFLKLKAPSRAPSRSASLLRCSSCPNWPAAETRGSELSFSWDNKLETAGFMRDTHETQWTNTAVLTCTGIPLTCVVFFFKAFIDVSFLYRCNSSLWINGQSQTAQNKIFIC